MDKGLISFLCYVSGLLTIGISITIPSLKLWHNTRLICVLRTQMHTHVHANTPTRLRTRSQTLIALSHCPNKKITNKPHCLFPQRISIRHKSAYAHRQTDIRVNIYKQRTQGSGASFHREWRWLKKRIKTRMDDFDINPTCFKLFLSDPFAPFSSPDTFISHFFLSFRHVFAALWLSYSHACWYSRLLKKEGIPLQSEK